MAFSAGTFAAFSFATAYTLLDAIKIRKCKARLERECVHVQAALPPEARQDCEHDKCQALYCLTANNTYWKAVECTSKACQRHGCAWWHKNVEEG